jgi:hypothetical protein
MAYPKTFKKANTKDRIVHSQSEEIQAAKDGYTLAKDPKDANDPPEGPGGDAAAQVQANQPHTDPIDPRTGSRSEHPDAPAPTQRAKLSPFPKTYVDELGDERIVNNAVEEADAVKRGYKETE